MASPQRPRPGAVDGAAPQRTLMQDIFGTGVWRIFPLMLLYVIGLAMVAPQVPGLLTDYMASRRAGFDIRCEDFKPAMQPPECRNAYSDVVWWSTSTSFVTNSVLTFLMAPLVGTWSDTVGRRPFLLTSMVLGSAPLLIISGHLSAGMPLLWYYPACALGGCVSIISITLAYIGDMLLREHRAAGFGGLMASFSVGILIGPAAGGALPAQTAAYVACGCGLLCIAYAFFVVPESLSPAAMMEARSRQADESPKAKHNISGLRILFRSPLFKRLTVCLMVSGIVSDGLSDLLIQYFKLLFNFTIRDVTMVFELFGVCGLLVQTVVLRYMLLWLGETRVLTTGLVAALLEMLAIAFIKVKWQAFGCIALGSLGGMAFPAISSIKANNVADSEQGTIQGALYGVKALATGTGPLMFAAMFAAFTKTDSPLPYFPGAPFLLGSALMVVAIGFALSIDPAAGRGHALLAPLLADDLEAAPLHASDLPLPNADLVHGHGAEDLEGLLVRNRSPEPAALHSGHGSNCNSHANDGDSHNLPTGNGALGTMQNGSGVA